MHRFEATTDVPVSAAQATTMPAAGSETAVGTVLAADDRASGRADMTALLAAEGYRALAAGDEGGALDLLARERPEVVLVHCGLLDRGAGIVRQLRALAPGLPILVYGRDSGARPWHGMLRDLDVGDAALDVDEPERLCELVAGTLAATRCVGRLRDEHELRSLVLTQLCHTLRAPLHVIQGYADLLRETPATPSADAALAGLAAAVANAMQLTGDHLALAGLDAPGVEVRCEPVELDGLIADLRRRAAHPASGRGVRLIASVPFRGAILYTDGDKLRALLGQLLARTEQCTTRRTIRLAVRCTAAGTRFELRDGNTRGAAAGAAAGAAGAPADASAGERAPDVGWSLAQRLCTLLGASLGTRRWPTGGALFTLDVPSALTLSSTDTARRTVH